MAQPEERIRHLLGEIDVTPFCPAERLLIDEALGLAEQHGLDQLAYAARLRLLPSAHHTGDTDAQLSAFAWCVSRNDADPVRYPTRIGEYDLLWFHKHVVGALLGNPMFSTADVDAAIDAMQQRYLREGVGLSGVRQARFQAAVRQGRHDAARELLAELRRTPRDRYSHCETCGRAEEAEFHYLTGDDAAGLRLADEILDQELTCGDEPENTMAQALLPLLRAGRADEARQLHLHGYRMARGNPDNLRMIAQHLRFCAVTGNEARGLEILERHLPWITHDGLNARAHLDALSAAGVVLAAADRAGAGDQVVRAASDPALARLLGGPDRTDRTWTVRGLTAAVRVAAGRLATAFDLRDGNDRHHRRLLEDVALPDTPYDVPLATRPATRPAVLAAPGNEGELRGQVAGLIAEAEMLMSGEPALALSAADDALRAGLRLGDRAVAVATARLAALAATRLGEDDAAVQYCRTAVQEATAGELPTEPAIRLELGAALCRAGEPDEGSLEFEAAIRRLRALHAGPAELAEAHFMLGQALAAGTDDPDDDSARDSYRDAVALASSAQDWPATTRYALALGDLLFARRDPQALTVLAGAVDSARQVSDSPLTLLRAMHLLGQAMAQTGKTEMAETVLREALDRAADPLAATDPAVLYEHADVLDSLARTIGDTDLFGERLDEAVTLARHSAGTFRAVGADAEAGRSLVLAAQLLDRADRTGEALPLLVEAEPLLAGRPRLLLECLTGLTQAYERLGRTLDARAATGRADRLRRQHLAGPVPFAPSAGDHTEDPDVLG
ncbi:hypothetical protein KIH74_26345 [Kineosporia sp. J2-2]|uniref:Tetratricopeptide repeat protein n=1 Tax=Kineosporia corallincola TaxID=2835133 RepID=A0ABS5TR13_9ACTN|nr:hypothetical protein [Kineosporia corallincola]MBT0772494.1 hypothetical protein [Kineosporia corallincola]